MTNTPSANLLHPKRRGGATARAAARSGSRREIIAMGDLVFVRRPTLRDADEFLAGVNASRLLHRGLAGPPDNAQRFREWVRRGRRDNTEQFFILTRDGGRIAGVININEVVRGVFQSGFLGYYALAPHNARGCMREGLALVIDHGFRRLGLHRLEANIQPHNQRSIDLVRSLGFRLEGHSPRYLKIAGRWRDHQRWAILAEEWTAARKAARRNQTQR